MTPDRLFILKANILEKDEYLSVTSFFTAGGRLDTIAEGLSF